MICVTNLDEIVMLFRPLMLIGTLVLGPLVSAGDVSATSNDFGPLARDASFFRSVLRHSAGAVRPAAVASLDARRAATPATPSDATKVEDDDGSRTAAYTGGAAVVGVVIYFLASSNGDRELLAPNRDDEGDVKLPQDDDPFVPPQPNQPVLPNQPNNPGTPGDQGGPGGPGDQGGPGSGDEPEIVPDPTTVTPEPISMTLLASGLAGMGVADLRRRRRRNA